MVNTRSHRSESEHGGNTPVSGPSQVTDSQTISETPLSMEAMQKELDALEMERQRAHLATRLEKIRLEKAAGFPSETPTLNLPIRSKEVDQLAIEKSITSATPTPYTGSNQRDYEQFVLACSRTFEQKPVTYAQEIQKILYAEGFMSGTPAIQWNTEKKQLLKTNPTILTWKYFVNFLQESLKPMHLRQLEVGRQLKEIKQRPGQSVPELVAYLESLEAQLTEQPTESQRHANLLHALHGYVRDAVIRARNEGETRHHLEEAARLAERTEPKPDWLKSALAKKKESARGRTQTQPSFQVRVEDSSTTDAPQAFIPTQPGAGRKRTRDDSDQSQITCWNCKKRGHKRSECRTPSRSGKARGQ